MDETNSVACAKPTTCHAVVCARGRWTAASDCVSAASGEERSRSKLSEHTHDTRLAGTSTSACTMLLEVLVPCKKACNAWLSHWDDDGRSCKQQAMHLCMRRVN